VADDDIQGASGVADPPDAVRLQPGGYIVRRAPNSSSNFAICA
jgi:hypothetical protein